MLTDTQQALFRTRGLLHLPAVLPTENAERSRKEILRLFEKHGFWRDGRWHQGSSGAFSRLLKRLKKSTDRGGFMMPNVHDAMTELAGGVELIPWSEKPELLFSSTRRAAKCPNTRPAPRLMMTQRFLLASVRGQIRTRYYQPPSY